jgi:hypothetical protein
MGECSGEFRILSLNLWYLLIPLGLWLGGSVFSYLERSLTGPAW